MLNADDGERHTLFPVGKSLDGSWRNRSSCCVAPTRR